MVTEISELKELGSCRSAESADGLRELTDYLTLYINMRVPLAERIIIEPNDNGYVLRNSHHNKIAEFDLFDDEILDVLMTIAPKKIILNGIGGFRDRELMRIIVAVFKERADLIF